MRNRGIDADDEIEVLYDSRRVGKVALIVGEIVQFHAMRRMGRCGRGWSNLQRDELHPRYVAKRRQRVESDRAAAIALNLAYVELAASPAQSDPQPGKTGKPLSPVSNVRRVCREIGCCRRNGFERGADGTRQAHQRAPQIEGRRPVAVSKDLAYARQPRQQSHQARVNREDGPPGTRGDLRHITAKLQRIFVALLGEQQNDPIPNRLAVPRRHPQKRAQPDLAFRLPAAFKLPPPFLQLSGQQKRLAKKHSPLSILRTEAQCRPIARLGFGNASQMIKYVPESAMSERMLRFEAQRRAYTGLGFLKAPEAVEHPSEFGVCVGKVRLQAQCLAQACLGLVQAVEVS